MFIFLFYHVVGYILLLFMVLSCSLPSCAAQSFLFVCFWGSRFWSPTINQRSLSQSEGWFSFILFCWREKYHWTGLLGLPINYTNMQLWKEMCPTFNFCRKHFWPFGKLTWLDKNIFHWIVKTSLKDDFVIYYFLWGPWIVTIVSCFCPLVLSTCCNGELLIACLHRTFCFKKIRAATTTAF